MTSIAMKGIEALRLQELWHSYFPLTQTDFSLWRTLVDQYSVSIIEKGIRNTFNKQAKFAGGITPEQSLTYFKSVCFTLHHYSKDEQGAKV